ncbi:hypothetical protein cand_021690 [Cryptosporidium andersoni]|uniref:Uncharacterized protein n=1 Tax=Cryptosporidium andersoni TaxID=117008 RepID=A0A1J4MUU5_9CRYT|nr:hypothetical protein cand_021690 [Cryptosporidium andersoni]
MDVDISRYTICITVILLKFSDIELRRSTEVNNSIIMFLQNESLYLTFNKMMDFVIYHQENNSLNQDNHLGISLVVCLSTVFLLLNKYGEYFVSSKILKSTLKNLFLYPFAHPKLFLHKNDNKCNHDSSMCINCLNYGLNSLNIKVKMVTLLCIIVSFINKEQDVEMTWNIDESILYHIYMNCLLYILPNSHNDEYSLIEEATFAKIMINLGSTMNLDYPFKYFNFMIYILYIINASPWWFDIHTIVNIPFVKKIGNLYNYIRSYCDKDNLENNTHSRRYLAVLEAILKSILSIVHRSNNISEDEFLNKEDNDAKVYSCLIEDILMNQQLDIKLNDKSKLESIFKAIDDHSTDKVVENCLKFSFNVVLNNIVKY